MRMIMLRLAIVGMALASGPGCVFGQRLEIVDFDISEFPTITAQIYVYNDKDSIIGGFTSDDFFVKDNGFDVNPIDIVECPPIEKIPIHAVLVNDQSRSMNATLRDGTGRFIDLARNGTLEFITTVEFCPGTLVGITAFDTTAHLIVPLTDSKVQLLTEIGGLDPNNQIGTNFNAAFLHPLFGAINQFDLNVVDVRRMVVLLTDGQPTADFPFDHNEVIRQARNADVEIYPIMINIGTPPLLELVAQRTGGKSFDSLESVDEAREIYAEIARTIQKPKPCTISWQARVNCDNPSRISLAEISYLPFGITEFTNYDYSEFYEFPEVNLANRVQICRGESTQLEATGSEGDFTWDPIIGLNDPAINDPIASPNESTVYTVTLTDEWGCTSTTSISVDVVDPQVRIEAPKTSLCRGESVRLVALGSDGDYSWFPPTGLSEVITTATVATPLEDTEYFVTVTLNGCTIRDSILIRIGDSDFGLDLGPERVICQGGTVLLEPRAGDLEGGEVTWRPSAGLSQPDSARTLATTTATTTYWMIVRKGDCLDSASVLVTVIDSPINVFAGRDTSICPGESIELLATGSGGVFTWTDAPSLSDINGPRAVATPTETTTYQVMLEDERNCIAIDEITVVVNELPTIVTRDEYAFCAGDGITLDIEAPDGATFEWRPITGLDDPTRKTPFASPSASAEYTVVVTSREGCRDSATAQVVVWPNPVVDIAPVEPFCIGESIELQAQVEGAQGGVYRWSPAEAVENADSRVTRTTPLEQTEYTVEFIDDNGCRQTQSITIEPLILDRCIVYVDRDLISDHGTDNFRIPVRMRYEGENKSIDNVSFVVELRIPAEMYLPERVSVGGLIQRVDGNMRIIQVRLDNISVARSGEIITEVIGTVLLPERLSSEISVELMDVETQECVEFGTEDGELRLNGSCLAYTLRIVAENIFRVSVSPSNPDEAIALNIETGRPGAHFIEVYNLAGVKVAQTTWNVDVPLDTVYEYEVQVPLGQTPSGMYFIVARNSGRSTTIPWAIER